MVKHILTKENLEQAPRDAVGRRGGRGDFCCMSLHGKGENVARAPRAAVGRRGGRGRF